MCSTGYADGVKVDDKYGLPDPFVCGRCKHFQVVRYTLSIVWTGTLIVLAAYSYMSANRQGFQPEYAIGDVIKVGCIQLKTCTLRLRFCLDARAPTLPVVAMCFLAGPLVVHVLCEEFLLYVILLPVGQVLCIDL